MPKNNVWKWTAKDNDGKPVESAPGLLSFQSRGPESEAEMRREGQRLLNAMRQREFDYTGKDPGYTVDAIEPLGHSDQTGEPIGDWKPFDASAAPVAMKPPVPVEERDETGAPLRRNVTDAAKP